MYDEVFSFPIVQLKLEIDGYSIKQYVFKMYYNITIKNISSCNKQARSYLLCKPYYLNNNKVCIAHNTEK